jgi:hypothetical protein
MGIVISFLVGAVVGVVAYVLITKGVVKQVVDDVKGKV